MMKSPKVKESAADAKARADEQARMEAGQLSDTQALLRSETMRRIRRFGQLAGAATNLPGFIGNMSSAAGGSASAGGAGVGGFGGGGGRGGAGGSLQMGTFY